MHNFPSCNRAVFFILSFFLSATVRYERINSSLMLQFKGLTVLVVIVFLEV